MTTAVHIFRFTLPHISWTTRWKSCGVRDGGEPSPGISLYPVIPRGWGTCSGGHTTTLPGVIRYPDIEFGCISSVSGGSVHYYRYTEIPLIKSLLHLVLRVESQLFVPNIAKSKLCRKAKRKSWS